MTVRLGAIRWDAWYANSGNAALAQSVIAPNAWQYRAPWFGKTGNNTLSCVGTQANMDAEISYASAAGLSFWAYDQYDPGGTNAVFNNAWALHQSSSVKNQINWCWIMVGYLAPIASYISWFKQSNYECLDWFTQTHSGLVKLRAPLLYIFGASITNSWVTQLRQACTAAGLGPPHIVVLNGNGNASTSFSAAQSLGADAISGYIGHGPSGAGTAYSDLASSVETWWTSLSALGPMQPLAQMGWNVLPDIQTPTSLGSYGPNYVLDGSVAQRAQHIQNAINYAEKNPLACPSQRVLIYAWNECSEGGGVLCPTIGDPPPSQMLAALTEIT